MAAGTSPMAVLSLAAQWDKSKLSSGDAWLLLLDLIWNGEHIRLARNPDPIEFDAGDGLGVQTYQPFNFDLSVDCGQTGQLPTVTLSASNAMRMLEGMIEQYSGLVGATANIYVYNTAHAAGEPDLALGTEILSTSSTASTVTLQCGAASPLRCLFPKFLYRATFCIYVSTYGGKWCGYQPQTVTAAINAAAAGLTIQNIGLNALAGTQIACTVAGFTGAWAAANGVQTLTVTGTNTATIALNSTGFGAMAGAPTVALTNCDGTYNGPNGCQTHANATRFGAFPGIGTNGGALAAQQ
jgi:phage-related protein